MVNPYTNKKNNYIFKKKEIILLDKAWDLINKFRETKISRSKYRKDIINKIKSEYTSQQFYVLEIIIEKMYWNLRNKIKNIFNIKQNIYKKGKVNDFDFGRIQKKILKKNKRAKESNVRKSYIYDENSKELLYKYDYPDDLDLIISSIIINRSAYETIMADKLSIFNLVTDPYNNIVEFDYPFPNLNTIDAFAQTKQKRFRNINNLYYVNNPEINWFL